MVLDKQLIFAEDVTVSASGAIGTPLNTEIVESNIGKGKKAFLVIRVSSALTSGAADGTAQFSIADCDTEGGTYADIVLGPQYAEGELSAGDELKIPVPDATRQYIVPRVTLGGTTPSVGLELVAITVE